MYSVSWVLPFISVNVVFDIREVLFNKFRNGSILI